jgi:hypothetical protein
MASRFSCRPVDTNRATLSSTLAGSYTMIRHPITCPTLVLDRHRPPCAVVDHFVYG